MSGRPEDWVDELFDREIEPHHAKDYDPQDLMRIALDDSQDVEIRLEAVQTISAWVQHQHNTVMRPEMVKRAEDNFATIDKMIPKIDAMKPAAQNYVKVLGGVYREPERAIEGFAVLADKYGVDYALDVIHKSPEQLGEMRGRSMFGWQNAERKAAMQALAEIDTESKQFWLTFNEGRAASNELKRILADEKTPEMKAYRATSIAVAGLAMDQMLPFGETLKHIALERYKELRDEDPLAAWQKATDEAKTGPWPSVDPYCHRWRREQKAMAQRVLHDPDLARRAHALGVLEDVRASADPFHRPPPKPPADARMKRVDHGQLSQDLARMLRGAAPVKSLRR